MTSSHSKASGELLWQQFVDADQRYYAARMALFQARTALLQSDADVLSLVRRALDDSPQWGPALRLLLDLDESVRRQVFPILVEIASSGHSNIQLVRDVILSMDRQWILDHIPTEMERVLDQEATYDEYRRFAELLELIHSPYLGALVARAAASDDPDIREVGEDYRSKV